MTVKDFEVDEWELYDKLQEMNDSIAEIERREAITLPKVALDWVEEVRKFSIHNDYPATMAFFVTLGQIMKDDVRIPLMGTPLDTRIHFCWIQTARSGKTTMFDFLQPTWEYLFNLMNRYPMTEEYQRISGGRPRGPIDEEDVKYKNISNPDAFTDQALLGTIKKNQPNPAYNRRAQGEDANLDVNGDPIDEHIDMYIPGGLSGSGIIAFDEFEHSGIFKETQHKQDTVMMFQKFMNKLDSDTHLIKKRLTDWGTDMEVDCQRSLWATTLPPQGLEQVILTKGVFQRMWLYVREISPSLKAEMEDMYLDSIGTIYEYEGDNPVFEQQALILYDIYLWVQERLRKTGDKRKITLFSQDAKNRIKIISKQMRQYTTNFEGNESMYVALDSFRMNTINNMCIAATLCAIAEKSPTITLRHMEQANRLTENSFDSITDWFSNKLKNKSTRVEAKKVEGVIVSAYEACQKNNGWVTKTQLIQTYMKRTNKARATFYRLWNKSSHLFEERTVDKKVQVRRNKK